MSRNLSMGAVLGGVFLIGTLFVPTPSVGDDYWQHQEQLRQQKQHHQAMQQEFRRQRQQQQWSDIQRRRAERQRQQAESWERFRDRQEQLSPYGR